MALPILETFAEHGYHLFHTPEAVYADFRAAGIFRRSGIDVASHASRLLQREALFDVALSNGMSSIIAIYVLAKDDKDTFLLQEPVAVQTWVKTRLERAKANVLEHLDSTTKLHGSVRHLRGMKQVIQALLERLEQGKAAALPKQLALDEATTAPWTTDALAYLLALKNELTSWERIAGFSLWLLDRFSSTELPAPRSPGLLDAILASAGLSELKPFPRTTSDLFVHLEGVDALTTGAILLFLTLGHQTHSTSSNSLVDLRAFAIDCAALLHLPRLHASHVLALWCIDQEKHLISTCDLLLESPPECMDRAVLVAVIDALLHVNQADLAFRIYSSFPLPLADQDGDLSLLLSVIKTCLALDLWPLTWMLARQYPTHIATTVPILIAYHRSSGTIHDVLLKMTWSPEEVDAWKAVLSPEDSFLLHLQRADFNNAKAQALAPPSPEIQLLLKTVPSSSTDFSVSLQGPAQNIRRTTNEAIKVTIAPVLPPPSQQQPVAAWPKPSKEQYANFFHKTTATSNGTTHLSLQIKKQAATATTTSPKRTTETPSTTIAQESTSRAMPYQFLLADAPTQGPHSASKAQSTRPLIEEPLELRPQEPDVFVTPLRHHLPKQAHTLPTRRNPLRDARKKY
ncbi:unnamed protein product [Aphanomyces euteiches]|nr:hypothetical protein AeRB84_019541 [Aphanomyces euteiches]